MFRSALTMTCLLPVLMVIIYCYYHVCYVRTNDIVYTVVAGVIGGVMGVIIIFQTVVIAILLTRAQRRLVC